MLVQDVRYALPSFLRAPGSTPVALVTLAHGIGGTTASFGIVDGVVMRALPYINPDRILRLARTQTERDEVPCSAPDYLAIAVLACMFGRAARCASIRS